jgi:ferric-dicitrate binding protein FerR (iron transport regulator)
MTKEELYILTDKYLAGTISPEERLQLQEWYRQGTREELLLDIPARDRQEDEMTLKASLYARIQEAIEKQAGDQPVPQLQPVRSFRWSYAAAAAVILLVIGGYWYFSHSGQFIQPVTQIQQPSIQNDVAPGSTKAVLTLADGSKIILDSAKTGQLATQGQTAVLNHNGAVTYSGKTTQQILYNTLTTGKGEQSPALTLSDGTKVWLNAASSIRFPVTFTGGIRQVEITGEAYFEVAHNTSQPFHVKVNEMEVQVLGTHFNINAYPDEKTVKTTLLEGSVKVSSIHPLSTVNSQLSIVLSPGQQAVLHHDNGTIVVHETDTDIAIAWKNGLFRFDETDLPTIMRQISRWYDVEVSYEGKIPERTFGGGIDRNLPLSSILKALGKNNIQYKTEGRKIMILP